VLIERKAHDTVVVWCRPTLHGDRSRCDRSHLGQTEARGSTEDPEVTFKYMPWKQHAGLIQATLEPQDTNNPNTLVTVALWGVSAPPSAQLSVGCSHISSN